MSLEQKVRIFENTFYFTDEHNYDYQEGSEILLNSFESKDLQNLIETYFQKRNKKISKPKKGKWKFREVDSKDYGNMRYIRTTHPEQLTYIIHDEQENYYGLVSIKCSETNVINIKVNHNPDVDYLDFHYNRPIEESKGFKRGFSLAIHIGKKYDSEKYQKNVVEANIFAKYLITKGFTIEEKNR